MKNDNADFQKMKARLAEVRAKMPPAISEAHDHSHKHRAELRKSRLCGCFYCEKTFSPTEINDWTDGGKTAFCPFCGIDSVLGDASGFPITKEFLHEMYEHWF